MAASADTLDYLRLLVVGRYIDMAAGCLVIFDSLLVLDLEMKLIWHSKWSIMKVMYFLNRYITLLDFVVVCIARTTTNNTYCPALAKVEGVLLILGIYFAEYTFAMRTYVIWEKRRIFWIPICIFYAASLIYYIISYCSSLKGGQYVILQSFNGCLLKFPPSNIWTIDMIILSAYDAVMIILTGLAAIGTRRRDPRFRPDLFRVLYVEGLLFYVYLLAFSIASLAAVSVFFGFAKGQFQSDPMSFHGTLREVNSCFPSHPSHPRDGSS